MKEDKSTERIEKERETLVGSRYLDKVDKESDEMQDLSYWKHPFLHNITQSFPKFGSMIIKRKKLLIFIILAACVVGYLIYHNMRVFQSYEVIKTSQRTDVTSTEFVEWKGKLLKYSSDGVVYMNKDSIVWSSAYSIQTPIVHTCESMAVVGEQNGSQIYIYNTEEGQIGNFETLLPIKKVKVASQGVVAAVLEDGEVTWINLYDTAGNEIAKHRTSVIESGYPVDVAISPDGEKMAISFLRTTNGILNTRVVFYNFGIVGRSKTNHEVSSEIYENTIVPKIEYLTDKTAVAFRDNGFTVFEGSQIPEKQFETTFDQDIVSIFFDANTLGFVFQSDLSEYRYKIQLYNLSGKKTMEQYIEEEFQDIKFSSGEIILHDTHTFSIYSKHGKKIFSGEYEDQIVDLMKISGFRKYLVITEGSMDQIRLT